MPLPSAVLPRPCSRGHEVYLFLPSCGGTGCVDAPSPLSVAACVERQCVLHAGSRRLCAASASRRTWWATFASFATGSSSSRTTTRRSARTRSRRCGRRVRGGRPGTGSKLLFLSPRFPRRGCELDGSLGLAELGRRLRLSENVAPRVPPLACDVDGVRCGSLEAVVTRGHLCGYGYGI